MGRDISKILFDKQDHELLRIVNDVLNRDKSLRSQKKLLYPYLHPHGIKEMAATKELRIAYAVIHLLDSLEVGEADDRINALRSLQDEVLTIAYTSLRINTARVLLQIMKELVRSHGDHRRQLELAHDFRTALSGKPRVIRRQLKRYHLLEMPEEWNQIAFDHHVHDSNTKGRKSPTHLIMDAWIKGIRRLTVVYYNYMQPEVAAELLEAAEIMGIIVRIGVEVTAKFRDRYIHLIWVPRGFSDAQDFLYFLAEIPVINFMDEGRKVSEYQQQYVFAVLREFNEKHRRTITKEFGLDLTSLDSSEFLSFVGVGQPSILHLAKFIHTKMMIAMQARVSDLREHYTEANPEERLEIASLVEEMNALDSEAIVERFLRPSKNPSIPDPNIYHDGSDTPRSLKLSPTEMIYRLNQFHCGYRITLNLSNLNVEDVLELLYECKGMITHLEIFNLKDYVAGKAFHVAEINVLQQAINDGNAITLKRVIREIIRRLETSENSATAERIEKLTKILHDIPTLQSYYKGDPLKARICSDSTGSSRHLPGMGLVIKETLPRRAQQELKRSSGPSNRIIPLSMTAYLCRTYLPYEYSNFLINAFNRLICNVPIFRVPFQKHREEWVIQKHSIRMESKGNIATLGGVQKGSGNGLYIESQKSQTNPTRIRWRYLNSDLKNGLKVLIGFIPAFATFALTKDWWLLAYFGAFIWFGITGLRNVLQSVLGGGGFRRSPLLRWNEYVSWERVSDSLLFTGFSVPLLDYIVKTLVLDQVFGITTATNPNALYTVIALANGLYISSHNTFRGLPKGAIFGNFFRTILSIPIAIGLNAAIGGVLTAIGVVGVYGILQKWAAVISKAASDCVAGIIEGTADRYNNIHIRSRDYAKKLAQLFDIYAQLELLFPETEVLEILESPKKLIKSKEVNALNLDKIVIIHSLDLLYFWMYQPRARNAMRIIMQSMSNEELQILTRSQYILQRQREISQLFIDGIVGKNFSKALSFYLDRSEEYLNAIRQIASAYMLRTASADSKK